MSRRANILERLRRRKNGAARYVVAAFALAYLSVGLAPCAAAASRAPDVTFAVRADGDHAHAAGAHQAQPADSRHDHHLTAASHEDAGAASHHGDHRCPHCPTGAGQPADHSSCFVLEDLTNVAASHAKDAPQTLAALFGPAPFTLPPPRASPTPPRLRAAAIPPVPLNVRHCVFLI